MNIVWKSDQPRSVSVIETVKVASIRPASKGRRASLRSDNMNSYTKSRMKSPPAEHTQREILRGRKQRKKILS